MVPVTRASLQAPQGWLTRSVQNGARGSDPAWDLLVSQLQSCFPGGGGQVSLQPVPCFAPAGDEQC